MLCLTAITTTSTTDQGNANARSRQVASALREDVEDTHSGPLVPYVSQSAGLTTHLLQDHAQGDLLMHLGNYHGTIASKEHRASFRSLAMLLDPPQVMLVMDLHLIETSLTMTLIRNHTIIVECS